MMLTIGSLAILFILLARGLLNKDGYFMFLIKILVIFSLYINIGYMFRIGSFEIHYSEFLMFFLVVFGLFKFRFQVSRKSIMVILFFFITIFCGYIMLINLDYPPLVLPMGRSWDTFYLNGESLTAAAIGSSHLLRLVRVTLFILVLYIFDHYILKDKNRLFSLKAFVIRSTVIFALVGVVEQVSKLTTGSNFITDIGTKILGSTDSHLTWIAERGGFPVLQGLTLEPGHYAQSFIPGILVLMLSKEFSEQKKLFGFFLFSYVIFFSGSFAGLAIVLFMFIIYLFNNRSFVPVKIFWLLTSAVGILIYLKGRNPLLLEYYSMRVTSFLKGQSVGTSEGVRMTSLKSAISLIKEYPFFGVGLGTTNVSGFLPTILVNIGIIGTFLWLILVMIGFKNTKLKNKIWLIFMIPLYFFIGDMKNIYGLEMIIIFVLVFREVSKSTCAVGIENEFKPKSIKIINWFKRMTKSNYVKSRIMKTVR